jgi:hypothetical protein
MDELTLLRTLRDDVPETTDRDLEPALKKLEAAMEGKKVRGGAHAPRARWVLVAATAAIILTLVTGNITMAVKSAQAAEILRTTAVQTTQFAEPIPGPGQYLLSHTHANWPSSFNNGPWTWDRQTIDVYIPADPDDDWVMYRDWGEQRAAQSGIPQIEVIHAKNGEFYGDGFSWGNWDGPISDVLDYFDAGYTGSSMSRDEDNFQRIASVLRTGIVPAAQRAAMYEALALIPGVTSTDGVANLDGQTGVAIGRTEPLRGGLRSEIIIDPSTGLVIGERDITTYAVFGLGYNDIFSLTAIETRVVDTAPEE